MAALRSKIARQPGCAGAELNDDAPQIRRATMMALSKPGRNGRLDPGEYGLVRGQPR